MKPWKPPSKPKPPSVPKKPEQHEQLLAGVARIEEALKKPLPITVINKCSCCADTQKEILALVRDIKTEVFKQSAEAEAAALAEVKSRLGPTVAHLEEIANKP